MRRTTVHFFKLDRQMGRRAALSGFPCLLFLSLWLGVGGQRAALGVDRSRLELGEAGLRELEGKAAHSPCWRDAVDQLDLSCKLLNDMEQSKLAVAFANCHLAKSGRATYPCSEEMSVLECTESMDTEAYQTYTHFFTHTGHICYFLQIELWQGRTEGLIGRLSHTSAEALLKLERSLEYHEAMDEKQDTALKNQDRILEQDRQIASSLSKTQADMEASFGDMSAMAEQQKAMLGEMFGSLQSSVEAVRGLMSLVVVEFVGWGTVVWFCLAWLVVMLLPQFHYSRFKLLVVLVVEGMVEVCVRRLYGYLVIAGDTPPSDLLVLHNMLWVCRYLCVGACLLQYMWEWYHYQDYGERNYRLLAEIRQLLRNGMSSSLHPPQQTTGVKPSGGTTRKTPIPLPYIPITTQPPITSQPPPPYLEDFADTPDSTQSTPHQDPHPHLHSTRKHSHFVLSSDEDDNLPDNDSAASRTKTSVSRHLREQKSWKHSQGDREEPSFSLLRTGQIFSDNDEDTPDNSHNLTRSPIRRSATSSKSTLLNNTPRVTSSSGGPRPTGRRAGSSKRTTGRPQRRPVSAAAVGEKPQGTSDPEPEKEVAEERDEAPVSGDIGRRSLRRSSDQMTGQLTTPTTPSEPHPLPQPSSAPKPHLRARTRSSTPAPETNSRYFLRDRTPKPQN